MGTRIVNKDAVSVLHDLVLHDPGVPALDSEDALCTRSVYFIVDDHRVASFGTTIGYVGLKVLTEVVLLDVGVSALDQENPLGEVALNPVITDIDAGTIGSADARPTVLTQGAVLIDTGPVLRA